MTHFSNLYDPYFQTLALLSLFIALFGLVSLFVKEKLYLTESLVAVMFGIVCGPVCLCFIDPRKWFSEEVFFRILMELSRLVIAFQIMAVGLCIPLHYVRKEWRSILMILGPCMVAMWVVSGCAVKFIMGFTWCESFVIGACLAPTDPVLANAVIKGKFANRYIPSHLRNLLSIESGANDGLGFPFLMLPLFMITTPPAAAFQDWIILTWFYEIFLAIIIGLVLGYAAKFLLEVSEENKLIDNESFLVYAIVLTMSITALVSLISSDDLLSVFIAGMVFAHDDKFHQATKDAHFQDVLDMLFNISFFIFLGTVLPWGLYKSLGLKNLFMTSGAIILFRRLPFIIVFKRWIPQLKSYKEAFFCGWFAPMGLGAIFFSLVTRFHLGPGEVSDNVFGVVTFIVLSSILIHGITVPMTHVHLNTRARRLKRKLDGIRVSGREGVTDPYADIVSETDTENYETDFKYEGHSKMEGGYVPISKYDTYGSMDSN